MCMCACVVWYVSVSGSAISGGLGVVSMTTTRVRGGGIPAPADHPQRPPHQYSSRTSATGNCSFVTCHVWSFFFLFRWGTWGEFREIWWKGEFSWKRKIRTDSYLHIQESHKFVSVACNTFVTCAFSTVKPDKNLSATF